MHTLYEDEAYTISTHSATPYLLQVSHEAHEMTTIYINSKENILVYNFCLGISALTHPMQFSSNAILYTIYYI